MFEPVPTLPRICHVCTRVGADNIVPDREEWRFYMFCTLCLDEFCILFPITSEFIFSREIYGKFMRKHKTQSKIFALKNYDCSKV